MTEHILDCTKKFPVHCIVELDTLLKEKLQLQKENELLIQQLSNYGLKQESVNLDLVTDLSSSSSDTGKLSLEIEALKLENKQLKSRIDRLEKEVVF
jgi:cell division septum initiation protein DivIVA